MGQYGTVYKKGGSSSAEHPIFHISNERLIEFKGIWRDNVGVELDNATAYENANNLLLFFSLLIKVARREGILIVPSKESPNAIEN